ncbi:DNA polymerase I [Dictyobacter kobayashii]|uniref:DNA polymerase I n=1 Tax=Dictyobacter kobayashii TaxID=2014872 RepID=A0A402AMT0_9CHLR|nr:DNA polymerase I [Dictyobacter kobayashii]GCE20416.1 DNA polymerase I [Dictyobacter kobayashii]
MKRKKLVLIDGHAIIHRAFHAVPEDLSTREGEPVNATFGFTSMLMKALLEERPDYIAVTFDRPSPTFRHLEYTPYKAHRPALPDNMKPQFARIREVVESFGIQIYEKDGFEADDILGTLSVQANKGGVDTIIYTGDMDTLQLVNEHVSVKVAKRGITDVTDYDEHEVQVRYGFEPKKLPDFKGLVGDKSDNIPGVPGIGEKTASRLIGEYGDLEGILAHLDGLKPKEQKLIGAAIEQARQSKYLATIVLDAPVQLELDACKMVHVDGEKVMTLFRQLEFRTLIERALSLFQQLGVTVSDTHGAASSSSAAAAPSQTSDSEPAFAPGEDPQFAPPMGVVPILLPPLPPGEETAVAQDVLEPLSVLTPAHEAAASQPASVAVATKEDPAQLSLFEVETPHEEVVHKLRLPGMPSPGSALLEDREAAKQTNTLIVNSEEGLRILVKSLADAGRFAIDTETSSDEPRHADLVGISLSMAPGEAYYLPVGHTKTVDGQEPDTQLPRSYVLEKLKPVLEDEHVLKYMHNAKYDLAIFLRYGIDMKGLAFDTMLGAYLAEPGRRGVGLKDQAFQRLGIVMTSISELIGTGSKMISMAQVPVRKAADYAGADADMTLRLVEPIQEELQQHGLMDMYQRIELPLINVLMQMELYGVALDVPFLREFGKTLEDQLEGLENTIYEAVGHRFNINSTKQLADVLFVELQLPTGKKTKTGFSVSADVIENLRGKHEVVDYLLEYRQLSKLKSTYVDGLLTLMEPHSGRVHTSFNQTIASSGRLSSSNPNLQNIPVRTELGRQIRRAFIADPSYVLLTADYSQFELRILAHITHEPRLVEAFSHNEDIHTITASTLFAVPVEQVTKDQRRLAKTVVYAVLYGQSAYGLANVTGMSTSEAAEFIKHYHEIFPNVKVYVDSTLQQAKTQGYVNTLYGRKRFFPDMHALSHTERQALEREAINMPIQGTNADLIKIAMIRLHHALKEKRMKTRMILQVHDELVFEVPVEELERVRIMIREMMEGVATLDVPIKVEMKMGKNWYEAEPMV